MIVSDFQYLQYQELDSTQNEAIRLIDKSAIPGCTIITADLQTSGYGQYQRAWKSLSGNLHITIVAKNKVDMDITKIPLKVASAITDFCNQKFATDLFYVKPINDIYAKHKKIGGILCQQYKGYLLIGIGMNIKHAPKDLPIAISMADIGINIDLDYHFIATLAEKVLSWL